MGEHKGVNTPSGRIDTYKDSKTGHTNYVQGGVSGGHTHSVPQSGHFDVTHPDGSKTDLSGGSGKSHNLGWGADKASDTSGSGGGGSGK
ncbi:MAG: hypothetical protein NTW50_05650 [Candidatus Berkelbacteria bacterium]|nr:hypothetical protein [Candidatus Berkelbacteria bacterium]